MNLRCRPATRYPHDLSGLFRISGKITSIKMGCSESVYRMSLTSYFACNDLRAVSWFFERLLFRFFAIFGSELVFFDCLRDEARRSPMLFILSLLLIGWRHFGHFLVSFAQDEQHNRWPQGLNWIVGVDSSQIKHRSGIISLSWKRNVFWGHIWIIWYDNNLTWQLLCRWDIFWLYRCIRGSWNCA